ncbi:Zinc finger protein [Sphaceloma murrayae]|uniref:Zinc finger protein n=1 Tax=Sphaceloma murrayae TaxID=2082308 RepID=A0A2K1QZE9_9PEZI|nr:Zinc finger protein [Sphaceloma murrayae]
MAMAVDSRQQMSGLPYEHMRYQAPHFTNPWVSASGAQSGQMYATSMSQGGQPAHHSTPMTHPATTGAMSYPAGSLPTLQVPSGAQNLDPSLFLGQDSQMQGYATRPYGADYPPSAASSSAGSFAPATTGAYAGSDYATSAHSQQKLSPYPSFNDRRASHPSVASNMFLGEPVGAARFRQSSLIDMENRLHSASDAERNSFSDALDASRGMVAMSQDITPRNIYGNQGSSRSSTDSYGFPSSHSTHSSISSASTHPTYYGSSVSEASYGDYSSASESIDVPSRTLPRPGSLVGASMPPNPSSMMGQFSSKVSSSSQKKHKCKICDKRFTRPSSLQTHMYSHTGEKRKRVVNHLCLKNNTSDIIPAFACDVEGCGRHFSVVSNLRRHKKVHKGEADDHPSPDDD